MSEIEEATMSGVEPTVAYRVDENGKARLFRIDEGEAKEAAGRLAGGSVTPVSLARLVDGLNELVPAVRNLSIGGPGR